MKEKELPLVSIGIPTYNSNKAVIKTVRSVAAQNYPNMEIIISDNASADDTEQVCRELQKELPYIRYYRQKENIGLFNNFDFVRKKAAGKYFMWVADDDTMEPQALSTYVSFLENNEDFVLVSGAIRYYRGEMVKYIERGFTHTSESGAKRALEYYSKVRDGGMWYGLMRREEGAQIPIRNTIGGDWHLVANLCYIGKIKNFDFIGYNKYLGGSTKSFAQYARVIGASPVWGRFPIFSMALSAFSEILYKSPVFRRAFFLKRTAMAVASFLIVLTQGSYHMNMDRLFKNRPRYKEAKTTA